MEQGPCVVTEALNVSRTICRESGRDGGRFNSAFGGGSRGGILMRFGHLRPSGDGGAGAASVVSASLASCSVAALESVYQTSDAIGVFQCRMQETYGLPSLPSITPLGRGLALESSGFAG